MLLPRTNFALQILRLFRLWSIQSKRPKSWPMVLLNFAKGDQWPLPWLMQVIKTILFGATERPPEVSPLQIVVATMQRSARTIANGLRNILMLPFSRIQSQQLKLWERQKFVRAKPLHYRFPIHNRTQLIHGLMEKRDYRQKFQPRAIIMWFHLAREVVCEILMQSVFL